MKIRIDVPCYNRKKITELSISQLYKYKTKDCDIRIYNDNSDEYDNNWLEQWGDVVNYEMPKDQQRWKNIHTIRYNAYLDFMNENYDFLYMTDNDAFHDPTYIKVLLNLYNKTKLPVTGYKSKFMSDFSVKYKYLTSKNEPFHIIRNTNGGISVFLSKSHVERLMKKYNPNTIMWDCDTWGLLGNKYVVPKISVLDHFGKGGIHNKDWSFDYAINPTEYLRKIRPYMINYLENKINKEEILKHI